MQETGQRAGHSRAWLALLMPVALGLAVSTIGERTPLGALALWGEPVLIAVALHWVMWLLWERRWSHAAALFIGAAAATASLRIPISDASLDGDEPEWAQELRTCTSASSTSRHPVRLVTWTAGPNERMGLQELAELQPDLVVLNDLTDRDAATALAEAMGDGEAQLMWFAGDTYGGGTALIVRGRFQSCADNRDSWEIQLPAESGRDARAVLTFPNISGAGAMPFIAVLVDRPGAPADWPGWPRRVLHASRMTASVARAVGPRRMLLGGNLRAPSTFRHVAANLQAAGLSAANVPPTWPRRMGPIPTPTLHTLEQAWHGESWKALASRAVTVSGATHDALLIDLAPRI